MRTVYFLSAGASKSIDDSFPLASELLGRILDEWKNSDPDTLAERRDHLREFHKSLPKYFSQLKFEELLEVIDAALGSGLPISKYQGGRLKKIKNDLLFCLWRVLAQDETGVSADSVWEKCRVLGPLIQECEGNQEATILTTNYDLLIEYATAETGFWVPMESLPEAPVNYSVPIRYGLSVGGSEGLTSSDYEADEKQVTFLKLHGSINWLYCPNCRKVDWFGIRPGGAAEALEKLWLCSECRTTYEPLVVPPAVGKSVSISLIKQIWEEAKIRLSQAERIVFAGFSLSESDIEIQRLLLLAKESSTSLQQVLIVDLAAETLLEKYRKIYGDIVRLAETGDWKEYVLEHIPMPYAR